MGKEFIFDSPQSFQSCHASTVLVLANGDILAAWFGGTREGHPDVDIWCSRRVDGKWSAPIQLASEPGIPHWNPVLFAGNDDKVYLYYKVGHTIPDWYTMVIVSSDNGMTWSCPNPLVEGDIGGRGPVRNKPIILEDGNWLAPASLESDIWDAFVDISLDQGASWTKSQTVSIHNTSQDNHVQIPDLPLTETSFIGKGVIQPTLWESRPGLVHMMLRSSEGCIYRSDSMDGGRTWSSAYRTALPNNNSGIDVVKLSNGSLALAYNPVSGNWAARTPLIISLSSDNGLNWKELCVLEDEPGEYSYPAIVAKGDEIFVTYTWKREKIVFVRIKID